MKVLKHKLICTSCARKKGAGWPVGRSAAGKMAVCPYCHTESLLCCLTDWNWPDKVEKGA